MTRREPKWGNVVDVQDASRLLECSQINRQLRFQQLVRRYLSQMLYGCTSAYCTTPTCLSCNKRLVSRPFRPPTQLTARALAYYLASLEDPRRGLCPHEPKVDPSSLGLEGADGIVISSSDGGSGCGSGSRSGSGQICHVFPNPESLPAHSSHSIAQRHQAKKDPKSLGQNMYDTVTIIYSYSKQLPSPLSVFDSLRSTPPLAQQSAYAASQHALTETPVGERNVTSKGASAEHANGQPPPTSNRPPSRSSDSRITSEVLSNGNHVHKIRHPLSLGSNGCVSRKSFAPSSLDGTTENPQRENPRLRAKSTNMQLPTRPTPNPSSLRSVAQKSHLSNAFVHESHPSLPVTSHLTCDILDELKDEVYLRRNQRSSHFNYFVGYDSANRHFRPAKPFVNRSMFFTLSDPETLLKSFRDQSNPAYADSPLPHLDASRLTIAFGDWNRRNGALIFDSLWIAVEALFRPPPELDTQKSPRLKPSRKDATPHQTFERSQTYYDHVSATPSRYLSDEEVAHIIMICIHALTALVPTSWSSTWAQIRTFRGWGIISPRAPLQTDHTNGFAQLVGIIDELEYEPAVRLAERLFSGMGTRMCFEHILASLGHGNEACGKASQSSHASPLATLLTKHLAVVERVAVAKKAKQKVNQHPAEDPGWTVTATLLEWLRTTVLKKFDGRGEVNKWSSIGAAITFLGFLHAHKDTLNLRDDMFSIPYLNERLDTVQEPLKFLDWEERPNHIHLFQFPFLFRDAYLVAYFRAINFTKMFDQFQHAGRMTHLQRRFDIVLDEPHWQTIERRLRVTKEDFLRLEITRDDPLKQTLDYLWGQERRVLLKPLKVIIGKGEGEHGFDQGGVTYEFFRLVLSDAFKPDNGLFTVDSQTSMIWFHPAPLEPMWTYQMLGVLFSLAVYNGITLPVTFPLAFYAYLLGPDHPHMNVDKLNTNFIRDGWPTLAKSFDELLAFEGDVEDIFMREYSFSHDAYGRTFNLDMQTSKEVECNAPLVTNANRAQFVQEYITYLTETSVANQLSTFRKGFLTCLHPKSLHLFTPYSLRSLIEGNPHISPALLRRYTRYEDGYSAMHPAINDFWAIVEKYSQQDLKRLLEFVTANERVPVTGYESMNFTILRAGEDTELLPTSSTCFGKLFLPQYAGREKMGEKLGIAIQYAQGFGVV